MQKVLRTLMLAAALLLPWVSNAQTMYLTVADGTATNSNVPVHGYWADSYLRCQTIYPSSLLTTASADMTGDSLRGVTYYLSSPAAAAWTGTWEVKVLEVTDFTSLSAFVDMTNAVTVYTGTLDGTQSTMTIDFATPYYYQGGSLLVEVSQTVKGNYKSCTFYGIESTASSFQGYSSSSYASITGSVQNFIPKTTFIYGDAPSCFKVQDLAAGTPTPTSLTLTWTDALNTSATYSVYNMADTTLVMSGITGTSYTVNGLDANTEYTFGVMTDCGGSDVTDFAIVSGRTACGALSSLPYACSFESNLMVGTSSALAIPYCWTRINTLASTETYSYYPYCTSGGQNLYFNASTYGTYADTTGIVLPQLDVSTYPMNGNRLVFNARISGSNPYVIQVGTMTDPSDLSTFAPVQSVTVTNTVNTRYAVSLSSASATAPYVALLVPKVTGSMYVDDVVLEEIPACVEISDLAVDEELTTSNSLTLTWEGSSDNTGATYTVYNMADSTVVASAIAATTYTVTGLAANTAYTLGVQANCANGDAVIITTSGRTACAAISSLPWTEDFEAVPSGSNPMPYCWSRLTTANTASTQYPYSSNVSNNRSLYYFGATTASYPDTMVGVLPQLNVTLYPMNGNRVSFWAKMGAANTSKNVYVCTLSDPTDLSTMTVVGQVNVNSNAYAQFFVSLSAAPATDAYVGLMVLKGSGNVNIDNLVLEELPSCVEVSNLTIAGTSSSSLTLSWTDADNAATTTYTVYNMADSSIVTSNVSGTTYTVTNLTATTSYTLGVQANCANGDAGIMTVSGMTTCEPETLPFAETFDATLNNDPCWNHATKLVSDVFAGQTLTFATSQQWSYSSSARCGLPAGHYYKNVYGTGVKSWLISPNIDLSSSTAPQLTFDIALTDYNNAALPDENGDTNTSQAFMVLVSTDGGATWPETNAVKWQNVGGDYTYASLASTTYQNKTVDLSAFAGDTIRIAFYCQSIWAGGDNDLHLDNIMVSETGSVSCDPPTNLTASNLTNTSATLTWEGTASSYNVYAINDSEFDLITTVATTNYTVTGLEANTYYVFAVSAVCGNDESTLVGTAFYTPCPNVELPYVETFDSISATRTCWKVKNSNAYNPIINTTIDGREVVRFSSFNSAESYHQYAYSPQFSADEGTAVLNMSVVYATYSSNDKLYFGYITATDTVWDPAEYTTSGSSDWSTYTAVIPAYATQVAIHYYGNYSFYAWVDSVAVSEQTGAYCFPANSLFADSITATSVTLNWNGDAAGYNVYRITDTDTVLVQSNVTSYSVDTLSPNTPYTYGVRAICDDSESDLVTIEFVTECNAVALPYTEDFEGEAPQCWTLVNVVVGTETTTSNPYSGSQAFMFFYTQEPPQYLISPELSGTENGIDLSFMYRAYSATWEESFAVGYSTTDNEIASFTWSTELTGLVNTTYAAYNDLLPAGTKYVAIKYTADDQFGLFIDSMVFAIPGENPQQSDSVLIAATTTFPSHGSVTINGVATNITHVLVGDTVSVVAIPDSGYTFAYWTVTYGAITDPSDYGRDTVYDNPVVIITDSSDAGSLIHFVANYESIGGVEDSSTVILATADATMGTTNPAPGQYRIGEGDSLIFSAVVNPGYHFLYWIREVRYTQTSDTYVDTIYGELHGFEAARWLLSTTATYTAYFEADSIPMTEEVTLTFAVNDASMGTIDPAPGTYRYAVGSQLTITATPNDGYHLKAWRLQIPAIAFDSTVTENITNSYSDMVIAMVDGATITAIFESNTGIEDVEGSHAIVYSTEGAIVVKGAENMDVYVYDVNGRIVRSQSNAAETVAFIMPSAGVYLVKVGNAPAQRVVVVR